jgi:hypothetical protein
LRLPRIDEDARNQESGQRKKEVHSHPPILKQLLGMKYGVSQAEVMQHHDQNRQAANGIELRNFSWHFLC